ncbi:MAG: protoporphyrinogen oxidase HemJ [Gammaproteobacteria bacterium]|nr:protoporphyrinogen oxidase HemJ [Gammaproteobacteria bacterium]
MLWIESFHVIFMVTWFAGLFYLPRLFVYHAMSDDQISNERFKIMERKLFYGIMTPGGVITVVLGLVMLQGYAWEAFGGTLWMQVKLALVAILLVYHIYCGKLVKDFKLDRNQKSHVFYRWFNEFPVILLIVIVILVIVRPG